MQVAVGDCFNNAKIDPIFNSTPKKPASLTPPDSTLSSDDSNLLEGSDEFGFAMRPDLIADVSNDDEDVAKDALAEARRVILEEADGLLRLADIIGASFCRAASQLMSISGRIIVTGLGKSGHIGRKIASTFVSTGSPAFFLHPGDFNHGELGAINRDDAVIMLSRSGDVPELIQTIYRCHQLQVPLIAITARSQSHLAKDANVALLIPDLPEACPHGLAPTTSAVTMLAMGDALAMYMMKKRSFSSSDFRRNHPGGNIGRRALSVRELLLKTESTKTNKQKQVPPRVSKTTPMEAAMPMVLSCGLGMVAVVGDDGRLAGTLTTACVGVGVEQKWPLTMSVGEFLSNLENFTDDGGMWSVDDLSVSEDTQVLTAVSKMTQHKLPGVFVVNALGYIIGFVPLISCLEAGISASC